MFDLTPVCDLVYAISRIDIILADEEGQVIHQIQTSFWPDIIKQLGLGLEHSLLKKAETLRRGEFSEEFIPSCKINYLILRSESDFLVVFGPYLYSQLSNSEIYEILAALSIPPAHYGLCREFFARLPHNLRRIQNTADLILTLLQNGVTTGIGMKHANNDPTLSNKSDSYLRQSSMRNVPAQYATEDLLRGAIRSGNLKQALYALSSNGSVFEYRRTHNSLFAAQHEASVLCTLMRIAAREGGVPHYSVHQISEKYFFIIGSSTSESELSALPAEMATDYCNAVRQAQIEHYSPQIQTAITFLHNHYLEHLTLHDVANAVPCHPTHLCNLFKKETGVTIIAMLNNIRLDQACSLLSDPKYPITEVGLDCGFDSYNHFSVLFKKRFGCTCTQWRKQVSTGHGHRWAN